MEQDLIHARCTKLRNEMRKRVTLPLYAANLTEVKSGIALPLYSCPYKNCDFSTDDRCMFLHHVCGGVSDTTHKRMLIENDILNKDLPWMTPYDYVHSAAAIAEQEGWPCIGLTTRRRNLTKLAERYNNENIQALVCFVCAQIQQFAAVIPAST